MTSPSSLRTFFTTKKQQIISDLETSEVEYKDKSPKGSVDVQIIDLIKEINDYEGLVTTSSCAGRITVFVEGSRNDDQGAETQQEQQQEADSAITDKRTKIKGGPAGKGGGRWLFVSHDALPIPSSGSQAGNYFTDLFGLSSSDKNGHLMFESGSVSSPRLIKLAFSPLILHVFCASLHHARPLLSAAINAGFRESGVQSLKGLDDARHGTMVAVRTAGLSFENVVGVVDDSQSESSMRSVVSEEYLRLCLGIINERFVWNSRRRERFREGLRKASEKEQIPTGMTERNAFASGRGWEDKDERRRRKREEGLRNQMEQHRQNNDIANEEAEELNGIEPRSELDEDLTSLELIEGSK